MAMRGRCSWSISEPPGDSLVRHWAFQPWHRQPVMSVVGLSCTWWNSSWHPWSLPARYQQRKFWWWTVSPDIAGSPLRAYLPYVQSHWFHIIATFKSSKVSLDNVRHVTFPPSSIQSIRKTIKRPANGQKRERASSMFHVEFSSVEEHWICQAKRRQPAL